MENFRISDILRSNERGVKIAQLVQELEENSEKLAQDYAECKATLIVNFGPNGREARIITGEERLLQMLVKVIDYYMTRAKVNQV